MNSDADSICCLSLVIKSLYNEFQAAIDEGVVVGGGCCLLRLSLRVDEIMNTLDNEEQKV